MIDNALKFIASETNKYLLRKTNQPDPAAKLLVLGNVARSQEGDPSNRPETSLSKGILTLVNLEEDRISKPPQNYVKVNDKIEYRNPKVYLNLYCLFAMAHGAYDIALQHLSLVIQLFQFKNVITHQNTPSSPDLPLDPRIEKLVFDLVTLNFEQVNHLWGTLGGKYLPSVLYKVRLVTIEEDTPQMQGEPILNVNINNHNKVS